MNECVRYATAADNNAIKENKDEDDDEDACLRNEEGINNT